MDKREFTRDDITLIVSAANIAGYMESKEESIIVDFDDELTSFIVDQLDCYKSSAVSALSRESWYIWIEKALLKKYGWQKDEPEEENA